MVFPLDTACCPVLVVQSSAHRSAEPTSLASPPTRSPSAYVLEPAIVRD